ncbi:MAG TPA: superinfection immunity protein [Nocardioides sp.]|nr:superinfection immunity protein [Nocardioides sp.]
MDADQMDTELRYDSMAVLVSMVVAVFTWGYMAPWLVATARGNPDHWRVFLLNLFLGWTVIGWVWSLVVAMRPPRPPRVVKTNGVVTELR